jgi:hypothetical protein
VDELNPVVLQVSKTWHIVEHSRRSKSALCGRSITHRGAHTRLSVVGPKHTCPKCLKIFQEFHTSNDTPLDIFPKKY